MDQIPPSTHCVRGELMDNFGILIQGILGMIAFSTLMLKRLREPKKLRRPWRIWFYDTSKQGFGTLFVHFANIYLADAFSASDPCTWYLISFILDSTIGLLLIYLELKLTQYIVHSLKLQTLYFGEYGDPPRCKAWLGQCLLYLIVMIVEKTLVGLMLLPSFWQEVRKYMLSWIKDPHLEVILVMLVIPFIVNTVMFWVIDNFLMRKTKHFHSSRSNVYSTLTVGAKGDSGKACRVSYRLAKRSDSLDSSEEGNAKMAENNADTTVRYHKMPGNAKTDIKRENSQSKDNDETLLLLQEEPDTQRPVGNRDVTSNGSMTYYSDNSADSENSNPEASKKHRLLTKNIKRL